MIKSYANKVTRQIAEGEQPKRIDKNLLAKALMRLIQIDNATALEDLKFPVSNHLEVLKGDRKDQLSIRVNKQWRICFNFENGHAFNVELVDYH